MTTVKLGSTGSDVKRLSELLGLSPRTVCDEEMVTKMKEYQKDYGLTPDGIFGYNSWKQILIAERYSKTPLGDIQKSDYSIFGWLLGCEPEMIQAFVQVESNGSGFLSGSGRPRILFESYQFWKYLKKEGKDPNKYLPENSDIITSKWVRNYKGGESEWDRLEKARKISKPFAMINSQGKEVVAVVKLKNRINGHRASMKEDYQILQETMLEKLNEQKINDWIREKQKTTYVRINSDWRNCEFLYPGWIKE